MSSADQADIDQDGTGPAAAIPSSDAPSPYPGDIDDLIATAVRRISSEITPVALLAPAGPRHAVETPATAPGAPVSGPGEAAEPTIAEVTAPAIAPTEAPSEPAETPANGPAENPAEVPLSYVPHTGDRMSAPPADTVTTERIEPTFDTQPSTPSLSIDLPAAAAPVAPSALTDAHPAKRQSILAGPWTWRRIARTAGLAVAAYFATVLVLILAYRVINPPTTTLIAYQWLTGTKIEQDWQPIENISPNLLRAVVVSEDWGFCDHYGVDIDALEKALELAGEGKVARGASTISMQVIKNLFLSQSKSYLRKAIEIPLTVVAETVWPKSRMLEIYLNIAEWGPGVFGAEAAARHHFNKPASKLTERESALLAAALPNPILRDAGDPSTRTARKASVIQARMRAAGPVANCAMTPRQRTARDSSSREPESSTGWQTTVKKRAGTDPGL